MFNIKIDKELLAYLGTKAVRLDELLVVICFGLGKVELLKTFLAGRNGDQCTAFMQGAERKRLIRKLSPGQESFDWDNYVVTQYGNEVYEECLANVSERDIQNMEVMLIDNPQVCITPTIEEDEMGQLVREFLALWPENTRNTNGDKLKSHSVDVLKRMKQFVKKYGYDKPTILAATTRYLNKQRAQGYAYTNQAMYYIMKDGISKLASECENNAGAEESTSTWDNLMS